MGRIWTRDDWNDIIRRVNDLAEECSLGDLLDEVPENHVWSVADITAVRNWLEDNCANSPPFSAELVKWKSDVIDELGEAINDCECGCTQATVDDAVSLHGQASWLPLSAENGSLTVNQWWDEDTQHWHEQWTYTRDYDWTGGVGTGYGIPGLTGIRHRCYVELSWYDGFTYQEHYSTVDELGFAVADGNGILTSAPSGTYTKIFPVDHRITMPVVTTAATFATTWDTLGAACA